MMAKDITSIVLRTLDRTDGDESTRELAENWLRRHMLETPEAGSLKIWLGDPPQATNVMDLVSSVKQSLDETIARMEVQIAELLQTVEAKDLEIATLSDQLLGQTDTPEMRKVIKRARDQRGTPHKNFRIPILCLLYKHNGSMHDFTKKVQTDPSMLEMELFSADYEIFQNKKPRWVTNMGNQAGYMQNEGLLQKRSHGVWSLTELGMHEAEKWKKE